MSLKHKIIAGKASFNGKAKKRNVKKSQLTKKDGDGVNIENPWKKKMELEADIKSFLETLTNAVGKKFDAELVHVDGRLRLDIPGRKNPYSGGSYYKADYAVCEKKGFFYHLFSEESKAKKHGIIIISIYKNNSGSELLEILLKVERKNIIDIAANVCRQFRDKFKNKINIVSSLI